MNASEDGTHSRALLDPGDAAIQISDAEQDMIEISRHIFLRKETAGGNHGRASYCEKHSSRQRPGRTGVDHTKHRQHCRCHTSLVIHRFNCPAGAWLGMTWG